MSYAPAAVAAITGLSVLVLLYYPATALSLMLPQWCITAIALAIFFGTLRLADADRKDPPK